MRVERSETKLFAKGGSSAVRATTMKTVYVLRVRPSDSVVWSEPEYYRTRKERDREAAVNRVLGGIRTHSYEEKKTPEEIEALFE